MGINYLIDTNTLLDYVAYSLPDPAHVFVGEVIEAGFNVSIINRIEVLGHRSATSELIAFMDLANTYELTDAVANQTIALRKQKKIKLPDAIIAATALVHDLTLISRNTGDFSGIAGLVCLNPHEMVYGRNLRRMAYFW